MERSMIVIRRWVASLIPLVYAIYLTVQSILLPNFLGRKLELVALVIYLLAVLPSLVLYKGLRLPVSQALYNLSAAIMMPALVIWQRESINDNSVGGWVVMGTAVVLTVTAVRQQRLLAVLGALSLAIQLLVNYGPLAAVTGGLIGAVVLVLAGLGVSAGIQKANAEVDEYRMQEKTSRAQIAATTATRIERATRLQQVLGAAIPMLTEISNSKTVLKDDKKKQAKLLELSLRDEIRGRNLLSQEMRFEINRLRNLGVDVAVLDEGGTDHLDAEQKAELLETAIASLQEITNGRVTIRSPRGESFALTVVATLPGQAAPLVSLRLSV
jgi:hypothetical protein